MDQFEVLTSFPLQQPIVIRLSSVTEGLGNFETCLAVVGNLHQKCQVFLAEKNSSFNMKFLKVTNLLLQGNDIKEKVYKV